MVSKIHILTFLFLSPTSLRKPPDATYMHLWSLRWKRQTNDNWKTVFCFLLWLRNAVTTFVLNSLITRAPSSGNWCRYTCFLIKARMPKIWEQSSCVLFNEIKRAWWFSRFNLYATKSKFVGASRIYITLVRWASRLEIEISIPGLSK